MQIQLKHAFSIHFFLLGLVLALTGCEKKVSSNVFIEVKSLENDANTEEFTSDIPRFVSTDKDVQKELEYVNDELQNLEDTYYKSRDKELKMWIKSYLADTEQIQQVTVCWFEEHPILGDDYNMMSLAYNKKNGEIITSKEALELTGITGVDLTTNVAKLFKSLHTSLNLEETEMQGFLMDEEGNVTSIFMKLVALNENDEYEQHFYQYDFNSDTLVPVSKSGYALP